MDRAEVQVREVERGITTGPAGIVRASLTHTETYLTKVNNKGDMYNGTREQSEHVIPHLRLHGRLRKRKKSAEKETDRSLDVDKRNDVEKAIDVGPVEEEEEEEEVMWTRQEGQKKKKKTWSVYFLI